MGNIKSSIAQTLQGRGWASSRWFFFNRITNNSRFSLLRCYGDPSDHRYHKKRKKKNTSPAAMMIIVASFFHVMVRSPMVTAAFPRASSIPPKSPAAAKQKKKEQKEPQELVKHNLQATLKIVLTCSRGVIEVNQSSCTRVFTSFLIESNMPIRPDTSKKETYASKLFHSLLIFIAKGLNLS